MNTYQHLPLLGERGAEKECLFNIIYSTMMPVPKNFHNEMASTEDSQLLLSIHSTLAIPIPFTLLVPPPSPSSMLILSSRFNSKDIALTSTALIHSILTHPLCQFISSTLSSNQTFTFHHIRSQAPLRQLISGAWILHLCPSFHVYVSFPYISVGTNNLSCKSSLSPYLLPYPLSYTTHILVLFSLAKLSLVSPQPYFHVFVQYQIKAFKLISPLSLFDHLN